MNKSNESYLFNIEQKARMFKEKTKKDFSDFYEKYFPKLVFYNNNILKDEEAAKDIATDVMLKSLYKIDDYDPNKARFSTWLFTISKNECFQYKKNQADKLISVDKFVDDDGTTIKDFLNDSSLEDEEIFQSKELDDKKGMILKERIKQLKEPYREVISLREIELRSYRDITIIMREENEIEIDDSYFITDHILHMVDPEKKEDNELIKFHTIDSVLDKYGDPVEFTILDIDKDGLISCIKLPKGEYTIIGETPYNISTIKSQIRNGRKLLQNAVKEEFEILDKTFQ